VRVDVLGAVTVWGEGPPAAGGAPTHIGGLALGGRRARVALVALALADHPIPAERLAAIVWANDPPPTWQPALRGVIRALRTALSPIGLGDQHLITTEPAGYALARQAQTDLKVAETDLDRAHPDTAPTQAILLAQSAAALRADDLLPQEDAEWLRPHREAIDQLRARAIEVIVAAAGMTNDHHRALAAARELLELHPLDERAHRTMIGALDRAGARAGAVQAYERCRTVLAEQLGIDPSADTVATYLKALRTDMPSSGPRLPAAAGVFVGRQDERRQLEIAIRDHRLVTITGRGGIGKSRLALRTARRHPSLWIPITTGDDELVAGQVAQDLGLTVGEADPARAVTDHLAPLGTVLLVLDGCEQATDGVASLVTTLLDSCPSLTVLATSRSALGLDRESILHLDALPAIGNHQDPISNQQVQLVIQRVHEAGGTVALDDANTPLIAALCQRCAGLPLALELVAAQLTVMSPADLLDELVDTTGDRLDAVLQYSYGLLQPAEAGVLRRYCVLGGAVSLPLIRAVVSDEDVPPIRVIRILRELTDRGLLNVDRSGPRWRYRQDDDIQRFAVAKMTDAEQRLTYRRLFSAVRALLPEDAKAPPGPFTPAITEITASVRSLLAAAVDGRVDRDLGLELAFRLHRFWAGTNVSEGIFWFSRLLDGAVPSEWTGLANFAYGYLSYWTGDSEGALPILDAAVRQLRGVHDDFAARALIYLGGIADDLDHGQQAVAYVRESVEIAERIGERNLYVGAAMGVGSVLGERGDPAAAEYALAALESCRLHAAPEQLASALPTAVMICWQVGALREAKELLAEGLLLHPDGRRIARVVLLSAATGICLAEDDIDRAIEYGQTADAEATAMGVERELPLIRCLLARALLRAGRTEDAANRVAAALQASKALTYQYPLALCLETTALIYPGAPERGVLLATAAELRRRGDRPIVPSLRDAGLSTAAVPIPPEDAVAIASGLLGLATGTAQHAKGIL
jgi:predicted ATPase/DNA-binding SARP family transcriptional activator